MMSLKHLMSVGFFLLLSNPLLPAHELVLESPSRRTPVFTDGGTAACLKCHSGPKMHAIAASAHGEHENPASPLASRGCEACHGPGSIHVSRAHGGRGFPALIRFGRGAAFSPREVQIHACLVCHSDNAGGRQMIEFLGSPHDRPNINCSTCHVVHMESDPMNDRQQQDKTCFRCHRKQKNDHPRFEDKSIDFDALSCATCHDVHKVITPWPADQADDKKPDQGPDGESNEKS